VSYPNFRDTLIGWLMNMQYALTRVEVRWREQWKSTLSVKCQLKLPMKMAMLLADLMYCRRLRRLAAERTVAYHVSSRYRNIFCLNLFQTSTSVRLAPTTVILRPVVTMASVVTTARATSAIPVMALLAQVMIRKQINAKLDLFWFV